MLGGDGVRLWGSCQNQPPASASSIGFPPVYHVGNWSALSEGQCHWLQRRALVAACGFLSFLGAPSACSLPLLGLAAPPPGLSFSALLTKMQKILVEEMCESSFWLFEKSVSNKQVPFFRKLVNTIV